jgi:hypothetical protein
MMPYPLQGYSSQVLRLHVACSARPSLNLELADFIFMAERRGKRESSTPARLAI